LGIKRALVVVTLRQPVKLCENAVLLPQLITKVRIPMFILPTKQKVSVSKKNKKRG
jgi:hypothetical protein